jgi:hypothetical protein
MHWNYRLQKLDSDLDTFALVEQYYNDDGTPMGHTDPVKVLCDSPQDLPDVLNRMAQAASRPVLPPDPPPDPSNWRDTLRRMMDRPIPDRELQAFLAEIKSIKQEE